MDYLDRWHDAAGARIIGFGYQYRRQETCLTLVMNLAGV